MSRLGSSGMLLLEQSCGSQQSCPQLTFSAVKVQKRCPADSSYLQSTWQHAVARPSQYGTSSSISGRLWHNWQFAQLAGCPTSVSASKTACRIKLDICPSLTQSLGPCWPPPHRSYRLPALLHTGRKAFFKYLLELALPWQSWGTKRQGTT